VRRTAIAAALAAGALAALAPAPADAQFIFDGGVRVVRAYELGVVVRGDVGIDYRGDEAAGCAERHLCDVSGTTVWRAPREGSLILAETVRRGRRGAFAALVFDGDGVVRSRTERAGAARCVDARRSPALVELPPASGSAVAIGIAGTSAADDLLRTRCAGPLTGDVVAALPAREVSLRDLRRGRLTLDLAGEREWRGGGFAGVARSTLRLDLGRARPADRGDGGLPRGVRTQRKRVVSVRYRIERAGGTIAARYAGVGDALACGPLDSCAVDGATTLGLAGAGGSFDLLAEGPAGLPRRRFLAALGIVRGGRARGIDLYGFGTLTGVGPPASSLARDGAPDCADTGAPLELGLGAFGRGRRRAGFEVTAARGPAGTLHTRCPGPIPTDLVEEGALVATTVPLRALGRRRVALRVRRVRGFEAPGYAGVVDADAELVLRRVRIAERTYREPVFDDEPF
jgi:hypothetical protein